MCSTSRRRARCFVPEPPEIAEPGAATGKVATGVLRRALRNAGVLLTGKAAAGLMQLATFAIAARSLGIGAFGLLSVLLAGMQLLIVLATFQSNQAIVRYGVMHLRSEDRSAFQRLIKFTTLLDIGAGIAAAAAAMLLAPLIAQWANWEQRELDAWRWLALLPLTLAVATPKGLLRLFGRFDLLSRFVTITPFLRLTGAILLAVLGGDLFGWVIMWIVAGAGGAAAGVFLGWREARRRGLLVGMDRTLSGLREANPGILRFSLIANIHSSLAQMPGHVATFSVGMVLGSGPAALMKVAQELGTALTKPIDLINQSVYPDIARLAASREWKRLRRLVLRTGAAAATVSALTTLLLLITGRGVIELVFGDGFDGAYRLLLLLSAATTVTVAVFSVDPTMYALGKPSRPLITALIANGLFVAVMFAAFPLLGLYAPGAAYVAAAVANLACALWWMATQVPRSRRGDTAS